MTKDKECNYIIATKFKIFIFALLSVMIILSVQFVAAAQLPVDLGTAGNFVILAKSGITNTGSHTSVITGNIGSSPITAAAMDNIFCSEIIGTIYGVDAAYTGSGDTTCFAGNPPLSHKTLVDNAVLDMVTAYNDAAGRALPDYTNLGAGNIGGMTLAPGLYKWTTDVTIPTSVTLSGGASDVWIFQIAGNLNIASSGSVSTGIKVILIGGAQASNVFWQVGGVTGATLGTYSTFNGNILTAKQIIMQTGVVLNGLALAQTQVTLDSNKVTLYNSNIPQQYCGDGIINGNEICDEGNLNGQVGHCNIQCTGTTTAVCGNSIKETGEDCDDGNSLNTDACNMSCKYTRCGDAIRQQPNGYGTNEVCDEGSLNGQLNHCNALCTGMTTDVCGNHILESSEQCDDGNSNNNDACKNDCTLNYCGDGYIYIGLEQCESDGDCLAEQICYSNCNCVVTSFCIPGTVSRQCGQTDIGECSYGTQTRTCDTGRIWGDWGVCAGALGPVGEICGDEKDNDCNGFVDENCFKGVPVMGNNLFILLIISTLILGLYYGFKKYSR